MATPYVSMRRLTENSMSALLGAVEIYNKPMMSYRDEVTVMLVVNAWELALKATLRQDGRSIFYKKKRGEPYRSLTLDDCLRKVSSSNLWPDKIDGVGIVANIKALAEYRDRAIHLYNAQGLGTIIHPFLQQNVLNYRDFMLARFKKDLADSMTWQLLPLGATAPAEAVRFMRTDTGATSVAEVQQFMETLRKIMDEAQAAGSEMSRVATVYDIHMQSVKKMTSADFSVAVDPTADGRVVLRKTDPNQTHPYPMKKLIEKVNERRTGRAINSYDFQAICWRYDLREDTRYAWKHSSDASHVWSGDAVSYFTSLSDSDYDRVRAEYSASRKQAPSK